jgi:hypothetical protein
MNIPLASVISQLNHVVSTAQDRCDDEHGLSPQICYKRLRALDECEVSG